MSNELSQTSEQFIHDVIAGGRFRDRTEVLDRAVELLRRREELVSDVRAGVDQLNRSDWTEYDEQSLDRFLHDIQTESGRLTRENAAP